MRRVCVGRKQKVKKNLLNNSPKKNTSFPYTAVRADSMVKTTKYLFGKVDTYAFFSVLNNNRIN